MTVILALGRLKQKGHDQPQLHRNTLTKVTNKKDLEQRWESKRLHM